MNQKTPSLPIVLANGQLFRQSQATVDIRDRGLAYGDGVFETMFAYKGCLPFWEYHQRRLLKGIEFLGIPFDKTALDRHCESLFDALAAHQQGCVVKLIVTRGESARGYVPESDSANYFSSINEFIPKPTLNENGCSVHLCQEVLAEPVSWAGLKTLNQLAYVLASKERMGTTFDEGLVCSNQGHIIEATARNLFCVKNGQLITPDLSGVGVAGVLRDVIIEQLATELNLEVMVCHITPNDLLNADEIFLCNSVTGIWPVTSLTGIPGDIHQCPVGEITRNIQASLQRFIEAKLS